MSAEPELRHADSVRPLSVSCSAWYCQPQNVISYPLKWTTSFDCVGAVNPTAFPVWPQGESANLYWNEPPFSAAMDQSNIPWRQCNNIAGNGELFVETHAQDKGDAAVGFTVTAPPPGDWSIMWLDLGIVEQYWADLHSAPVASESAYGQVSLYVTDNMASGAVVLKQDWHLYDLWVQDVFGSKEIGTSTNGNWVSPANYQTASFAATPGHSYNVWVWAENYNSETCLPSTCTEDMMAVQVYSVQYAFLPGQG